MATFGPIACQLPNQQGDEVFLLEAIRKTVGRHDTNIPNRHRKPFTNDHLDHYVGHHRLVDSGDKGDISITRVSDKLVDTWANGEARELFPGKYDTFFSREDDWVERFLRD